MKNNERAYYKNRGLKVGRLCAAGLLYFDNMKIKNDCNWVYEPVIAEDQ